jgi:hypothetical protein
MGADGIIAKLKRDYKYSVTRLCTDPPDFRFVLLKNMIKCIISIYRVSLRCQASSWCDHIEGL